jgi:hypothetical protein
MKLYGSCPVIEDFFSADGRTDMTKIMAAFCVFAIAPEMEVGEVKSNTTKYKRFT